MERHVLLAAARVKKLGRGQMYRAHCTGRVYDARPMGAIHLARPMGVSPVNAFFQADVSWVTNYDVVK
jgi:hypothetical protein